MPPEDEQLPGHGLSRKQQRILLWMPLVTIWLILLLISEGPEGDRDWPSLVAMLVVCTVVYVGVWFALMRMTSAEKRAPRSTSEKLSETGSRAGLIYGKREDPPADEAEDQDQP